MSNTMHINSLPDLVLYLIFSKVPLRDLLISGRVCALWRSYQMSICKQVRSLSLLIGSTDTHQFITKSSFTLKYRDQLFDEDGTRMYSSQYLHEFFHLSIISFSSECASELSNIFPCITSLEIVIKFKWLNQTLFFELNLMIVLLAQWSLMLKSLKIYLHFNSSFIPSNMVKGNKFSNLLDMINSMQSLKHFTLDTDTSIRQLLTKYSTDPRPVPLNSSLPISIDLPILGRVREFYFKSNDELNIIEKSLQSYAISNDNLKQIGLDLKIYGDSYSRYTKLASKFVHLSFNNTTFSSQICDILKSFSSITMLNLVNLFENGNYQTSDILNFVSSLPQLTHLYLNCYYKDFLAQDRLPQLTSVQVLTIFTKLKSTSMFESNHWAHLFPNVQVVELILSSVTSWNIDPTLLYLSKQQLEKMLSPFAQCLKLHLLFTCEKCTLCGGIRNIEHLPMLNKEWILLQVGDRKIINQQVEK